MVRGTTDAPEKRPVPKPRWGGIVNGVAICSQPLAAQAGAEVMRRGGNAVDAAVSVAATLCVVDPANCGFAGYGGYMIIQSPGEGEAWTVDFNTSVPEGFRADHLARASRCGVFANGPLSVAMPAVPRGLEQAHRRFGSRSFSELLAPAIDAAERGFAIDRNLAKAIRWATRRSAAPEPEWARIFCPGGTPLREDDVLVQQDLANTLRGYAGSPETIYAQAPFAHLWNHLAQRTHDSWWYDRLASTVSVKRAEAVESGDMLVYGPTPHESGFGIFKTALAYYLEESAAPAGRTGSSLDLAAFIGGLRLAWRERAAEYAETEPVTRHTSHFCVLDPDGMLVSCTFTHGPLWFGSGVVVPGTGLLLNCGLNLARYSWRRNTWVAVNNMTPVVAIADRGARYAIGAPGGSRIPAIVLKTTIESVLGGLPISTSIARPRISISPDGALECERDAGIEGSTRELTAEDFYGPASAIHVDDEGGGIDVGMDPRCASATAWV